uniref:Epstein-Barr virus EBNA-1-like protein n=1 Tax=Oryza sativa subsp. japonica TaxID=39947 RepID=Q6Z3P5_ORYSJ|nr:Epstein-Barr virus EBNA-1-like protein [Oryza sativa Japonica Group]
MMTVGGKREKGGEKEGLPPCRFGEKEEGEKATRQRGGALPPSLGGTRGERRGRVDDDGDDGGAVWSGAATRAADAGQARQALTAAATGRSATTARARGRRSDLGGIGGNGSESGREGSARLTAERGERERDREREPGREGEMGREGFGPSNPREAK